MSNAERFIQNSEFSALYIAKIIEASFYGEKWYGEEIRVPHGLPFTPLVRGIWSTTPDFSWANDFGVQAEEGLLGAQSGGGSLTFEVDSKNIILSGGADKKTTYLKIACFVPPDYEGDLTPFDTVGSFKFNSDKKYLKVVASGKINKGEAVVHGLGYIPLIWIFPVADGKYVSDYQLSIDENMFRLDKFSFAGSESGFAYYFVFGDSYATNRFIKNSEYDTAIKAYAVDGVIKIPSRRHYSYDTYKLDFNVPDGYYLAQTIWRLNSGQWIQGDAPVLYERGNSDFFLRAISRQSKKNVFTAMAYAWAWGGGPSEVMPEFIVEVKAFFMKLPV